MTKKEELKIVIIKARKQGLTKKDILHLKDKYKDHDLLVRTINIQRFIKEYGKNFNETWLADFQFIGAIDSNYNEITIN